MSAATVLMDETGRPAVCALPAATDDELMARCRAGSADALAELVGRHRPCLVRFARDWLGDAELAESAAQTAFLRLWSNRDVYEPRGTFKAYLRRLCFNACRERARSRRRRNRATERYEAARVVELRPNAEDGVLDRERDAEVGRAVARLPEPLREAVVLRFYEDLTYREMSARVGGPEVTLRSRVHHALKKLRPVLSAT